MRLPVVIPAPFAAALAALIGVASPAYAGDVAVEVRTPQGWPVADAVVTVVPASGGTAPAKFAQAPTMAQHGLMFVPFVLVVPVGATVTFPNEDAVRHQVYSFSPAKTFELKLYGREAARTVTFDKAGVVALGCNIHDKMSAFIDVVDAPFAAKTDATGKVVLKGIPAGAATVRVWRPYMKTPKSEQSFRVSVPASGVVSQGVTADLRPPPMAMSGY